MEATVRALANDLVRANSEEKLFLLGNMMIGADITGNAVHCFFALLRGALVEATGTEWTALHAPPGATGARVREFPLHSDLYVCPMLMNIFDEVPDDGSGATSFIRSSDFLEVVQEVDSVPHWCRARIAECFHGERSEDGFDELYTLVYGKGTGLVRTPNLWTEDLVLAMDSRKEEICLRRGEGYLLDDRKWLHGRAAPSGGVPARRIHRLVYTPR